MKNKNKIRFPRGVVSVHVPFVPEYGSYEQLYEAIDKVKIPKSARMVVAQLTVSVDLRGGRTNYEIAEVILEK